MVVFHQIFDEGWGDNSAARPTRQGFSSSRVMHIRPVAIVTMARKTVRGIMACNVFIPKTCPSEETIQSPVERQAKNT